MSRLSMLVGSVIQCERVLTNIVLKASLTDKSDIVYGGYVR